MIGDGQIYRQKVQISGRHRGSFSIAGQNAAATVDIIKPGKGKAFFFTSPALVKLGDITGEKFQL